MANAAASATSAVACYIHLATDVLSFEFCVQILTATKIVLALKPGLPTKLTFCFDYGQIGSARCFSLTR